MRRRSAVSVRIRHVVWRQGRPRFQPGPGLRALGFTGRDLKTEAGAWLTLDEVSKWVAALEREIEVIRAKARPKRRAAASTAPAQDTATPVIHSLGHVVADALARRRAATLEPGRDRAANGARSLPVRPLAPKTLHWYHQLAGRLAAVAPDAWAMPAAHVDAAAARALYEQLNEAIGHATARGIIALCSMSFADARRHGTAATAGNPFQDLGIPGSPARVRVGSPDEIAALIAAADAMGRPEIGDMVMIAVWSGQRQADRLALAITDRGEGGRVELRQAKTRAVVSIPVAGPLAARLSAARTRRLARGHVSTRAVIDETTGQPMTADLYRRLFRLARTAAAKSVPSIADLTDQDLRDTAVTWLSRAGCTIPEICAITGHALQSATQILQHYMLIDGTLADTAIAKLTRWHEGS